MSGPEAPKGPWGRGESEPTARAEFEARLNRQLRENKKSPLSQKESAMLFFASYFVNYPFAERHESFPLHDDGSLDSNPDDENMTLMELAEWTGGNGACTADDLRRAAVELQKVYPELHFAFEEDRTAKRFSYKATLVDDNS